MSRHIRVLVDFQVVLREKRGIKEAKALLPFSTEKVSRLTALDFPPMQVHLAEETRRLLEWDLGTRASEDAKNAWGMSWRVARNRVDTTTKGVFAPLHPLSQTIPDVTGVSRCQEPDDLPRNVVSEGGAGFLFLGYPCSKSRLPE